MSIGDGEFKKDFDGWIEAKKQFHSMLGNVYAYPREIWWCAIGVNVGAEIDGKNENFERPVVIVKVYNKETLIVLPLTTRGRDDKFHFQIAFRSKESWAKLTQHRVISTKRLVRKIGVLDKERFELLRKAWKESL